MNQSVDSGPRRVPQGDSVDNSLGNLEVGTVLPALETRITRERLIRYAGASGDFNPIHWNERFAREVGLPDVVAHGMLTMALGARPVTNWLGDPGRLVEYSVRFTRPVVVPDDDQGSAVEFTGTVGEIRADNTARVDVTAKYDGKTVLGKAQAIVRLPERS